LTNSLLNTYDPSKLKTAIKKISHKINEKIEIPDVSLLRKAFSDMALKYIYSLKEEINTLGEKERKFFLFSLLTILNSISKAKKSGGFLRVTEHRRVAPDTIKKVFLETFSRFIEQMDTYKYSGYEAKAIIGDARRYPHEVKQYKYDAILTSPPYPNRHDYTRIYALELLVGFIKNNQTLKQLRYQTLRSHVEARRKYIVKDYFPPLVLKKKLDELSKRKLNNKQIIPTITGYFEDMYLCLNEMKSVLKPNKHLGLVISNVRFAGVMIPVDEILCRVGEQLGLRIKNIIALRYRGNSSQQMLQYKRMPNRESLIVFRR
jgi:hypothetical protein